MIRVVSTQHTLSTDSLLRCECGLSTGLKLEIPILVISLLLTTTALQSYTVPDLLSHVCKAQPWVGMEGQDCR